VKIGRPGRAYGLFRQPIIFFSASFLRKKLCFFLKNDALKEFLWAAHNDEGVMRQPNFHLHFESKVRVSQLRLIRLCISFEIKIIFYLVLEFFNTNPGAVKLWDYSLNDNF
jgi:hypothetical protein